MRTGAAKPPLPLSRGAVVPLGLSLFIPDVLFLETALLQPVPGILLLGTWVLRFRRELFPFASIPFSLPLKVTRVGFSTIVIMLLVVFMHELKSIFAFLIQSVFGARTGAAIVPLEGLSSFLLAPAIPTPAVVRIGAT